MSKLKVISPFYGKTLAELDFNTEEQISAQINRMHNAFINSQTTKFERINKLELLIKNLDSIKEKIIETMCLEGCKPIRDATIEFERAKEGIKSAISCMRELAGNETPLGHTENSINHFGFNIYIPKGVVFAISAFNHPLNMVIHQVIPALAIGCPVLLKPSLRTPLTALLFTDIVHKSGINKDFFDICLTKNENIINIIQNKKISTINFIGATDVGNMIRKNAHEYCEFIMEFGGAAPVIIDQDYNWQKILPGLIKASFANAGQVCVSTQRIFVHKNELNNFLLEFKELTEKLVVGETLSPQSDLSSLSSPEAVTRIMSMLEDAVKNEGKIITGGKELDNNCIEPTIILNPSPKAIISKKEVFGPVVCVYSYENLDEAIDKANSTNYCFQSSIFSNHQSHINQFVQQIKASTVLINEHTIFRIDSMPFGGETDSGNGMAGIKNSILKLLKTKQIIINLAY